MIFRFCSNAGPEEFDSMRWMIPWVVAGIAVFIYRKFGGRLRGRLAAVLLLMWLATQGWFGVTVSHVFCCQPGLCGLEQPIAWGSQ